MSRYEIKKRAREALGGKLFGARWLYPILLLAAVSLVTALISYIPIAGAIAALILIGAVNIGVTNYFLTMLHDDEAHKNLGLVLDGAKKNVLGGFTVTLLASLYTTLWSLLFVIPGIVKMYSYSMVYFIKRDHPEYTANQAITESRRIMHGHKWEYFVLQLSFIGWYIVGILCLFVGALWVAPYVYMSSAVFYESIKGDSPSGYADFGGDSDNAQRRESPSPYQASARTPYQASAPSAAKRESSAPKSNLFGAYTHPSLSKSRSKKQSDEYGDDYIYS